MLKEKQSDYCRNVSITTTSLGLWAYRQQHHEPAADTIVHCSDGKTVSMQKACFDSTHGFMRILSQSQLASCSYLLIMLIFDIAHYVEGKFVRFQYTVNPGTCLNPHQDKIHKVTVSSSLCCGKVSLIIVDVLYSNNHEL